MRVFLDTNVLVAAFAARGLCEDVFRAVLTEHELFVGATVIDELTRVLANKLKMPTEKAQSVAAFIRHEATVLSPERPAPWPESDPDDRWIVAAAIEGEVDVLVTGDQDLLSLNGALEFPVVSPRGFWEMLQQ
jgi:putative PIN family toxin of toxin-antitoxin system